VLLMWWGLWIIALGLLIALLAVINLLLMLWTTLLMLIVMTMSAAASATISLHQTSVHCRLSSNFPYNSNLTTGDSKSPSQPSK
jgi:hypothetical protein